MPLTSLLLALAVAAPAVEPVPAPAADAPPTAEVVTVDAPPAPTPMPEDDDLPQVSIRVAANGDRVEEYRDHGQLYLVKITPLRGPAYYLYDNDGNGRLEYDDRGPTIAPVHWVVYEWD